MSKTLLFGGSGFFGPIILKKYPKIISVGRSKPPKNVKNKHIHISSLSDLKKLDKIKFDKVIFLIGSSNHHIINNKKIMPSNRVASNRISLFMINWSNKFVVIALLIISALALSKQAWA